jgi:hypothetical protein
MNYIERKAEKSIKRMLKVFPVLGVTGPRQSGKSTMLKHLLKDYEYVTFDDFQKISLYDSDPVGFMKRYNNKIIFDEVQNVPEIFRSIKLLVDENREKYGNFILTGSSNFSFLKSASESLAGRIGLLSLLPFEYMEIPLAKRKQAIFKGSYPELTIRNYNESNLWYSSYVETYINKDLRVLANIGDLRDFRKFIWLLASRISQTLDLTSYSKDLGISVPTLKRWISILEASYIIFLLPPYYKNSKKRIVKSPKVYFYDTGLVSYFTGIQTFEQYDLGPMSGAIFENYIISEIHKKNLHSLSDFNLYYIRTYDQDEIDLIIDKKTHLELIEIKKNHTFKISMIDTLTKFKSKNDICYLLYQGKKEEYRDINILPYSDYLKL